MPDDLIPVNLLLTPQEAALLTAATCDYFHHMKAVHKDEIFGALIDNEAVLASRSVWYKVEAITKIG